MHLLQQRWTVEYLRCCFFQSMYKLNSIICYPPFASIAKGEVFGLLYLCLFVRQRFLSNPRADSRHILHAGVAWVRTCLLSFWGLAGGKRGKWNFRYYGSQWGIFAFWRFLSDISATRARIHTKYYLCRDNVCRCPLPLWDPSAPGGRGEGELKTQKIGGGLIRAADSYHFYFSQRYQMWSSM